MASKTTKTPPQAAAHIRKLRRMLSAPENQHLVHWDDKRPSCFIVEDKEAFLREVLPKYYEVNSIDSFKRSCCGYGFQISAPRGGPTISFAHATFHRNRPELDATIEGRPKPGKGRRAGLGQHVDTNSSRAAGGGAGAMMGPVTADSALSFRASDGHSPLRPVAPAAPYGGAGADHVPASVVAGAAPSSEAEELARERDEYRQSYVAVLALLGEERAESQALRARIQQLEAEVGAAAAAAGSPGAFSASGGAIGGGGGGGGDGDDSSRLMPIDPAGSSSSWGAGAAGGSVGGSPSPYPEEGGEEGRGKSDGAAYSDGRDEEGAIPLRIALPDKARASAGCGDPAAADPAEAFAEEGDVDADYDWMAAVLDDVTAMLGASTPARAASSCSGGALTRSATPGGAHDDGLASLVLPVGAGY